MADASSATLWNPEQYERFKDERSRPFFDLLALVRPRVGMRVVDLGCGTGELTRDLHVKLAAEETLGIDSAESMLAKSAPFAGDGLRFEQAKIEAWTVGAPVDLIFSNAALQWVEGQEPLLARLASMLAPGGQLAVQVPANEDHASHVVAAEVAREAPFAEALGGHVRRSSNLRLEQYATLLYRLGFDEMTVRMQVYGHRLPSREGVVEWVKGTLLTDYAKRMPADLFTRFVSRYREALLPRLADSAEPAGKAEYFFGFKRILFWGAKA
jgi:trans-aconitate 2-methyltransferase